MTRYATKMSGCLPVIGFEIYISEQWRDMFVVQVLHQLHEKFTIIYVHSTDKQYTASAQILRIYLAA